MSPDNHCLVSGHRHRTARAGEGLFVDMTVGQDAAVDEVTLQCDDFPPVRVLLTAGVWALKCH
ncbi:MAG: hypothetical protein ACE366_14045 [Bradymonadia bacterium]